MLTLERIRKAVSLPFAEVENNSPTMSLLKSVLQIWNPEKNHVVEKPKVFREFNTRDKNFLEKTLALKKTPLKNNSKNTPSKLGKLHNALKLCDPRNNLFLKHFQDYLSEIENLTHMKIPECQKNQLLLYAQNKPIQHLSKEAKNISKKEYNLKRSTMIQEWELHTGQKWPTSSGPFHTNNGKFTTNRSHRHQLHHIILISFGGPNVWWNAHPATNDAHVKIHHKKSVSKLIFDLDHPMKNSRLLKTACVS
jgi:hypothetical protein